MLKQLEQDIKYLKGVGPVRAEVLKKELGIVSFRDLLYYYPYKYVDRSRIYYICEINGSIPYVQRIGQIPSFESVTTVRMTSLVSFFADRTGVIFLVWFQGVKYAQKNYQCRTTYIVFGRPTVFNGRIQIAHPDIDKVDGDTTSLEETIEFDGGMLSPQNLATA